MKSNKSFHPWKWRKRRTTDEVEPKVSFHARVNNQFPLRAARAMTHRSSSKNDECSYHLTTFHLFTSCLSGYFSSSRFMFVHIAISFSDSGALGMDKGSTFIGHNSMWVDNMAWNMNTQERRASEWMIEICKILSVDNCWVGKSSEMDFEVTTFFSWEDNTQHITVLWLLLFYEQRERELVGAHKGEIEVGRD